MEGSAVAVKVLSAPAVIPGWRSTASLSMVHGTCGVQASLFLSESGSFLEEGTTNYSWN